MSKSFDHYSGSMREARRASYVAGVDACLDYTMKVIEQASKKALADDPALSVALLNVSNKVYEAVIDNCLVKTPYEAEIEDRPTRARSGRRVGTETGNTTANTQDDGPRG